MICLCVIIKNIYSASNFDFELIGEDANDLDTDIDDERNFVCVQNNAFDRFDAKYPNTQKVVLEKGTALTCPVFLEKVSDFEETQTNLFFVHNKSLNCLSAIKCEYGEFEIIKDQKIKYKGKEHELKENIKVFIHKGKLILETPNIIMACRSGITSIQKEKLYENECSFNTTIFKVNLTLFELKQKIKKIKPQISVNEGRFELDKKFFKRSLQKMYITNNICAKEKELTFSSEEFNKFFENVLGFLICENSQYKKLLENPMEIKVCSELLFVVDDDQTDVNANIDDTFIDQLETQSSDLGKELEEAMMYLDD